MVFSMFSVSFSDLGCWFRACCSMVADWVWHNVIISQISLTTSEVFEGWWSRGTSSLSPSPGTRAFSCIKVLPLFHSLNVSSWTLSRKGSMPSSQILYG